MMQVDQIHFGAVSNKLGEGVNDENGQVAVCDPRATGSIPTAGYYGLS